MKDSNSERDDRHFHNIQLNHRDGMIAAMEKDMDNLRSLLKEKDNEIECLKSQIERLKEEHCEDQEVLNALIEGGVDNWEGYEIAMNNL